MNLSVTNLLDIGSIVLIILSVFSLMLAELLSRRYSEIGIPMENKSARALQISVGVISILVFLLINLVVGIGVMRIVVAIFVLSGIIPFSITFLILWLIVRRAGIARIQYVSYISWITSLSIFMVLRIPLGWGAFDSLAANLAVAALFSILTGLLGSIIGNIMINKLEMYRPSKKTLFGD